MELNDSQKKAVGISQGPALIIAGAGTGKTSVIVERIRSLLDSGVSPQKIVALTFTEKAATEMIERVSMLTQQSLLSMPIFTYNGFGASILEEFAVDIGLGSHLRLLGETAQLVFLRDHLDELELDYFSPVSRPDSQLVLVRDYFSKLKQHIITPEQYSDFVLTMPNDDDAERLEKQKHQELSHAYAHYQKLCHKQHMIDYDDQIYLSVQLLKKRPNVQRVLQNRYDYIIVDEFQDTNPMQSVLLDFIVNTSQNIMVVGDDDQSIYGWRGATLSNILNFTERYPTTKQIVLQDNYRSTQPILDAAYTLIQNNNPQRLEYLTGLNKRLVAHKTGNKKPQLHHFDHQLNELEWISGDIKQRLKNGQEPGSITILARRNSDVSQIHNVLSQQGINHVVIGAGTSVFDTLAVKQLLQILQAVHDPHDDTALYHALSSSIFTIDNQLLAKASHDAKISHLDLIEILRTAQDGSINAAIDQLQDWGMRQKTQTVGEIAYAIVTETGWSLALYQQAQSNNDSALQLQGLGMFFDVIADFTKTSSYPTLAMFLESLPLLASTILDIKDDSTQQSKEQVSVMSIHKAKGLEWSTVYLFNCTEGSLPLKARRSSLVIPDQLVQQSVADEHEAEERRLLYVAMTRAISELIMTYSDTKTGISKTKVSRFILEIGDEYYESAEHSASTIRQVIASDTTKQRMSLPQDILQGETIVLNVTQVATWLRCPEDFYYTYVLKTPQAPNPALEYGTLIHSCIDQINRAKINNTSLTLQQLIDDSNNRWPKYGYSSLKQRERAIAQGKKTLSSIYERFYIQNTSHPLKSEFPFRITLPNLNVVITGRIDAVFQDSDGAVIVDYKTGSGVNTAEKAKQRASASKQLTLYALAWQDLFNELPKQLQLDFVETGFVGSVVRQQRSIDTLKREIEFMANNLRKGTYPQTSSHEYCSHPIR